jgi:hypothetical protein
MKDVRVVVLVFSAIFHNHDLMLVCGLLITVDVLLDIGKVVYRVPN